MDKRSLLAIVVTFMVLILWQTLYLGPKQEKKAAEINQKEEYAGLDSLAEQEMSGVGKKEARKYNLDLLERLLALEEGTG